MGGLYTSQCMGLTFLMAGLPAILRKNGMPLGEVTRFYAFGLFWTISFLWAPLVDRFGRTCQGHYKNWIIAMQTLLVLALVWGAMLSIPSQIQALMLPVALVAFFSATQDLSVDALGTKLFCKEERGTANSIQSAGNMIGGMIGGGLILFFYETLGWQKSMLALAIGTALPLMFSLGFKEPATAPGPGVYKNMAGFFKQKQIRHSLGLIVTARISILLNYSLLSPILVDLGWPLDKVGVAVNCLGAGFGVAGAAGAGVAIHRLGKKTALVIFLALSGLASLVMMVPGRSLDIEQISYLGIGLAMAGFGAVNAVMYTLFMDHARTSCPGTDFSLQMALSSIPAFAVLSIAMGLADRLGYTLPLAISAAWALLPMGLILFNKG